MKGPMTVERLQAGLERLYRRMDALEAATGLFCTDEELDSAKGNPKLRFTPKGFKGGDFKGQLASDAPPDFLDAYSKTLAWFAENPKPLEAGLSDRERDEALKKQEKSAKFDKLDAKRCRSWARRKRLDGWKPPPPPPEAQGLGELPALGGDPFLSSDQALAETGLSLGTSDMPGHETGGSDLAGPWDAHLPPAESETTKVSDVAGDDLDDALEGLPE